MTTVSAAACDHRVMASNALVHFVQAKMGVSTGWGGGGRLVALVGRQHALRLLPGSLPCSASEALACGLADAVADPGRAVAKAMDLLQPYLANPGRSFALPVFACPPINLC